MLLKKWVNNWQSSTNMINFNGQTAIITGGASGIGREVAIQLAALGANTVIADANEPSAQHTANALLKKGLSALSLRVDVADPDSVEEMVSATLERFGDLHILIHSAGIGVEAPFLETSLDNWQKVINVDLTGTFLCGQAAAKHMARQRYGRIINLASTAGILGGTGRAAYGSAKGGVITLTKVMAVELSDYCITVNALAPGAIETEMVTKMHSQQTRITYTKAIPLDRYGTPTEVAFSALFLASQEASYITGQILGVDGGFLAAGVMHKND